MPSHLAHILDKYFPKKAYEHLESLISAYHFSFKVTKNRISKLGDFRAREGDTPTITVNGSLNPYSFLITFLHELAHLAVHLEYGRQVKPHGTEWKNQFQEFLLEAIKHHIFPDELLPAILSFINNPKASTSATPALMKALASYDQHKPNLGEVYLDEIPIGMQFSFRGEHYLKIEKRRTRVLCERVSDKRRYTIAGHAEVFIG